MTSNNNDTIDNNNNYSSNGSDGLVRRSADNIDAARTFLFEASDDDDSFAGILGGEMDNFPVHVRSSRSILGRPGTNLSNSLAGENRRNSKITDDPNSVEGRGKRLWNTLRYRGIVIPQKLKVKRIGVIMVLILGLTGCLVWIDQSHKNDENNLTKGGNLKNSSSKSGGGSDSGNNNNNNNNNNQAFHRTRIEQFRQIISDLKVSSEEDLGKRGTPQHTALNWISNQDGAKLKAENPNALERYVLAVLYYTTAGTDETGHWEESTHWMTDSGICNWHGVTCAGDPLDAADSDKNDHHGVVERLELSDLGLKGSIPSELGSLQRLYLLDLSRNDLTGTLPKSLSQLKRLRELDFSNNLIGGTIHGHYGTELTNLQHFHLAVNQFVGSIPSQIAAMVELRSLNLNTNMLTGTLPDFEDLTKIRTLMLGNNQLEGPFPTSVSRLTSMLHLNLGWNHLTGTIPEEMIQMTALEILLLQEMNLHGTIPDKLFEKVTRLTELGLSSNDLRGSIPTSIGHLKDLHDLYLGQNKLHGSIPRQIGLLSDLNSLDLQGNLLTGSIPNLVSTLNGLETLNLARNKLTGMIPPEVGHMHRLRSLLLETNKLTGGVPTELGNLRSLKQVRLYENRLEGTIPREVCELITDEELIFLGADCGHEFTCDCCTKCF